MTLVVHRYLASRLSRSIAFACARRAISPSLRTRPCPWEIAPSFWSLLIASICCFEPLLLSLVVFSHRRRSLLSQLCEHHVPYPSATLTQVTHSKVHTITDAESNHRRRRERAFAARDNRERSQGRARTSRSSAQAASGGSLSKEGKRICRAELRARKTRRALRFPNRCRSRGCHTWLRKRRLGYEP